MTSVEYATLLQVERETGLTKFKSFIKAKIGQYIVCLYVFYTGSVHMYFFVVFAPGLQNRRNSHMQVCNSVFWDSGLYIASGPLRLSPKTRF